MKLPFEIINKKLQELHDYAVLFDDELYYSLYAKYLKEAGWSEEEYDVATLNYIDSHWNFDLN